MNHWLIEAQVVLASRIQTRTRPKNCSSEDKIRTAGTSPACTQEGVGTGKVRSRIMIRVIMLVLPGGKARMGIIVLFNNIVTIIAITVTCDLLFQIHHYGRSTEGFWVSAF